MRITPFLKRKLKAFTLVEVMVAVVILGIMGTALGSLYLYSLRASNITTNNVKLATQIRTFCDQIRIDTQGASEFAIYNNFDVSPRVLATTNQVGNYCVLHYTDANNLIYKSIGYYILSGATQTAPSTLKKHTNYWPTPYAKASDVPLPTTAQSSTHITVSTGIAGLHQSGNDYFLFKNQDDNKIIINANAIILQPGGALRSGVSQINKEFSLVLLLET